VEMCRAFSPLGASFFGDKEPRFVSILGGDSPGFKAVKPLIP
jgi:hypothetical protein